jgi:hypothetical protein
MNDAGGGWDFVKTHAIGAAGRIVMSV